VDITRYPRIAARVLLKRANLSFVLMYVMTDAYGDNIKRRARRAGGPCCQMKNMNFRGLASCTAEVNIIGLDLDWAGFGLCRILLNLDWIRTVNCFMNLGSGPNLDWVNVKELR